MSKAEENPLPFAGITDEELAKVTAGDDRQVESALLKLTADKLFPRHAAFSDLQREAADLGNQAAKETDLASEVQIQGKQITLLMRMLIEKPGLGDKILDGAHMFKELAGAAGKDLRQLFNKIGNGIATAARETAKAIRRNVGKAKIAVINFFRSVGKVFGDAKAWVAQRFADTKLSVLKTVSGVLEGAASKAMNVAVKFGEVSVGLETKSRQLGGRKAAEGKEARERRQAFSELPFAGVANLGQALKGRGSRPKAARPARRQQPGRTTA